MRFGLITQWYDPEPGPAALPGVLARGLVSLGHEVQVLTGFPNYPSGVVAPGYSISRRFDETCDGIDIRRVALYPSHDSSAGRRFASYASFGASAVVSGLNALRDCDALWVNYSPITVSWAMWAAKWQAQVQAVVHVLDLWPDTIASGGIGARAIRSKVARASLDRWCGAIYGAAHSVAYISPSVGDVLCERGVEDTKLHYVPMWADERFLDPTVPGMRRELGIPEDAVVLLYAGTLGEAQGLSTLIDACALVRNPRFLCLIAGSGVAQEALRARAADVCAHNIRFLGRIPATRMAALTATSDLNYVSLRSDALSRMTMPSKVQASLAAGRAILAAADGDVSRVALDSGGFSVCPGDPAAIAKTLEGVAKLSRSELANRGAIARAYYEATFSAEVGVRRVESLLTAAARESR
jgi:colanic acid biosynthesis glycosyl transferase WcaI